MGSSGLQVGKSMRAGCNSQGIGIPRPLSNERLRVRGARNSMSTPTGGGAVMRLDDYVYPSVSDIDQKE